MMTKLEQLKIMQSGVCFCYFGKTKAKKKKTKKSSKGCFYYNMKTKSQKTYFNWIKTVRISQFFDNTLCLYFVGLKFEPNLRID